MRAVNVNKFGCDPNLERQHPDPVLRQVEERDVGKVKKKVGCFIQPVPREIESTESRAGPVLIIIITNTRLYLRKKGDKIVGSVELG